MELGWSIRHTIASFMKLTALLAFGLAALGLRRHGFQSESDPALLTLVLFVGILLPTYALGVMLLGPRCPHCGQFKLRPLRRSQYKAWRLGTYYFRCMMCGAHLKRRGRGAWLDADTKEDALIYHPLRPATWLEDFRPQADHSTIGELLRAKRLGDLESEIDPARSPFRPLSERGEKPKYPKPGETTQGWLLRNKRRRGLSPSGEATEAAPPPMTVFDPWLDGGSN